VSCEAQELVHAYVDGELAGHDRDEYEQHLASCEACALACRLQGRFKAAVRAHLPRPPVPEAFRMRLDAALATAPLAPRRWPWLTHPRLVPAAFAAAALVALIVNVRGRSPVLDQAQRAFRTAMPMDVTGPDCSSIASWFQGRVDFPVHAPSLGGAMPCKGGRLVNVRDRPAAYLLYQAPGGHVVSFLVFDPQDESFEAPRRRELSGRKVYFGNGPGLTTVIYQDRGLGYAATSDLDEDSMARLVNTSFQRQ